MLVFTDFVGFPGFCVLLEILCFWVFVGGYLLWLM